jgi:hypothetical protein
MMNWKRLGRKPSWPNFKVLFRYSPGGTEESTKTVIQDSQSPGRDLNPGFPEHEEWKPPDHDVRVVSP